MRRFVVCILMVCAACQMPRSRNATVPLASGALRDCAGPATSLAPQLAATLAPRTGRMVPDDRWADIAATAPGGFAGVLYRDGKPILKLTRPEEADDAKAALAPLVRSFPIAKATIKPARWDFAQLVDWYNYLAQRTPLWRLNVITGDKDESRNRLVYGISDSVHLKLVRSLLDSLAIPCDLVVLEIRGPIGFR